MKTVLNGNYGLMVTKMDARLQAGGIGSMILAIALLAGGCKQASPENQLDSAIKQETEVRSESNSDRIPPLESFKELVVFKPTGEESMLAELIGTQNLVVVFSRGYFGSICPFCSTQMYQLADAYREFEQRNARVVVIFPIDDSADQETWRQLETSILDRLPSGSRLPFPILIDQNLTAVDQLGIRDALSKPSIFIIDPTGIERYRYIGRDPSDRPTVETILDKLDGLNSK